MSLNLDPTHKKPSPPGSADVPVGITLDLDQTRKNAPPGNADVPFGMNLKNRFSLSAIKGNSPQHISLEDVAGNHLFRGRWFFRHIHKRRRLASYDVDD